MGKVYQSLVGPNRKKRLAEYVQETSHLTGPCAEVGVYKGSTAYVISQHKGTRSLYIFDTFEGIPEVCEKDNYHKKGDFNDANLETVISKLSSFPNVHAYKGIFPQENSEIIKSFNFSLVHLDVDIYKSYKDCLEFFYPKMQQGGIIVMDDYLAGSCKGAKIAIDEFFEDKPEKPCDLLNCQVRIIKE